MGKSQVEHTQKAFGYAATDGSGILKPFHFARRENRDEDVTVKVLYCGICHSDLHHSRNEWGFADYPMVPGHEMIGVVASVGKGVKKFKVGERVGVGVMVGSCKSCNLCKQNSDNYCPEIVFTYNSIDFDGTKTYGGYSDIIVVDENFVLRIPEGLPSDAAAPLLCAGAATYSPMKYYGMNEPGKHLGVAGLGGLGHVAVKIAKAFGLYVTVISNNKNQKSEAFRLGADSFIDNTDQEQLKEAVGTMDYILSTISAVYSLTPLLDMLKVNGKLVTLGLPVKPLQLSIFDIVLGRKFIGGSNIGSTEDTQEMLDFCAKHNITADIELVKMQDVNKAMDRLAKADVKYRFVIDVANSLSQEI
ncbi:probable cinnamyl alcohol dehydrogenase 9 [Tripterygium wilfordii]|uniref:probable cinnamyl alcohol dehydrogenase 9 n=1 Tax=Tripterygium wilfordii TaxID=458696 RepID=UPI0018F83E10|nr:probable cinnamyl alcohol dehydrogenase 9 [Tripterygium wilfordii]